MKNYIYDAMWSQELEDLVENDKAKPLIMEMYYKYGLKVYDALTIRRGMIEWTEGDNEITDNQKSTHKFMMTLDGLPYCQVYVDELVAGKPEFCFYSVYYEKERGKTRDDKRTVRSAKISGLMRMIDKYKCVIDGAEKIIGSDVLNSVSHSVVTEHIKGRRLMSYDRPKFDNAQFLDILGCVVTGKKPTVEAMEFYKKAFDILDKEAQDVRQAEEEIKSIIGGEMYVLAEDIHNGICIGKAKLNLVGDFRVAGLEVTDGFQRLPSLEDYPEYDLLKPTLLMYKIMTEQQMQKDGFRLDQNMTIQRVQGYMPDLQVITSASTYNNNASFTVRYMFIPVDPQSDAN